MSFKYREDPSKLQCFKACMSCFRCEDKGKYDKCRSCSGRADPAAIKDPYHFDDRCRCKEGILQVRLKNGKLVQRPTPGNPFGGTVRHEKVTENEKEYIEWLKEERERRNDPAWNPTHNQVKEND